MTAEQIMEKVNDLRDKDKLLERTEIRAKLDEIIEQYENEKENSKKV